MDEQTFLTCLQAAENTLYHVACTLLRSEADRCDALQDTALRAWQHRDTLRQREYFTTWAVRILINVCRSMGRRQGRMVPTDTLQDRPAPEGDTELHLVLDAMPEKHRLPLVLFYLEGFSIQEMARALGIPAGTVKYRLHQARKALKLEMNDGEEAADHEGK